MDFFTYKGISAGKYIEGEIEALNQEEASHKLKGDKVIITSLVKSKKKKNEKKEKKRQAVFHLVRKKLRLKML
jgi:type IV pilus assembly protein PilC